MGNKKIRKALKRAVCPGTQQNHCGRCALCLISTYDEQLSFWDR